MRQHRRPGLSCQFLAAFTLICSALIVPERAHADTCPGSVNVGTGGTLTLTADYAGGGTNCFNVTGVNATVNLNGHVVRGTGGANGIECLSSGIRVTDSAGTGSITGAWVVGIKNCQIVDHVTFSDAYSVPGYALTNSSSYPLVSLTDSVIDEIGPSPEGGVAFDGYLANSQSKIADNSFEVLLSGINVHGMVGGGLGKARIENNTITGGLYGQLVVDGTTQVNVENNVLAGRDPGSDCTDLDAGVTYSRLYCDCAECDSDDPTYDFPAFGSPSSCPGTLALNDFNALTGIYTLPSSFDLAATSGACITVAYAGRKIDLNGHTITNSSTGGTGITFTASGGGVQDSGTPKGGIAGNFATGISEADNITAIRIEGPDVGISASSSKPLTSLSQSTVRADTTAVSVYLKDRATSFIQDNLMRGGYRGLDVLGVVTTSGSAKPPITENLFRESSEFAIDTHYSNLNLHDNLMYRRDASAVSPTASKCLKFSVAPTYNHQLCDCPSTDTYTCEGDIPPLTFPLF